MTDNLAVVTAQSSFPCICINLVTAIRFVIASTKGHHWHYTYSVKLPSKWLSKKLYYDLALKRCYCACTKANKQSSGV